MKRFTEIYGDLNLAGKELWYHDGKDTYKAVVTNFDINKGITIKDFKGNICWCVSFPEPNPRLCPESKEKIDRIIVGRLELTVDYSNQFLEIPESYCPFYKE